MKQSVRHEVKSLMSEAFKAAEGYEHARALGVLTEAARGAMRGASGMKPEYYAARQAKALAMVKGAKVVAAFSSPAVLEPLAKAEALLMAQPEEAAVMMPEAVEGPAPF